MIPARYTRRDPAKNAVYSGLGGLRIACPAHAPVLLDADYVLVCRTDEECFVCMDRRFQRELGVFFAVALFSAAALIYIASNFGVFA